jgi:hypothetical protein
MVGRSLEYQGKHLPASPLAFPSAEKAKSFFQGIEFAGLPFGLSFGRKGEIILSRDRSSASGNFISKIHFAKAVNTRPPYSDFYVTACAYGKCTEKGFFFRLKVRRIFRTNHEKRG